MKPNMKIRHFAMSAAMLVCMYGADAQEKPVVQGFVHETSEASEYVVPEDAAVRAKLDEWQDLKFGVLFHWGLYSVPGIVESWSICSEDEDWIYRGKDLPYDEYKKWYWGLKDEFNPVNFNPAQWADVMQDAGMKYMIFTTKHHDGFCMFDSKYTDFSIAHGAFADDPRRNVALYVFDAFRDRNFMTGFYFSKPDWHCEWYWNPYFATPRRIQNYNRERHPDWWRNYVEFTQNQLRELMTDYGRCDILWLDGGWVSGEQIGIGDILKEARSRYPGLIAVDRLMRDEYENYLTPERGVPAYPLGCPWESCIPLSNDWGWVPDAPYKSARQVINTLCEITAKGGCLLLGVGPTPDGVIEDAVVERLHSVGEWLRANGEAIYGTRPAAHYNDGNVWFTAAKDGRTMYAVYTLPDGEKLPATIEWSGNLPSGRMTLLSSGKTVKYSVRDGKVSARLPKGTKDDTMVIKFILD